MDSNLDITESDIRDMLTESDLVEVDKVEFTTLKYLYNDTSISADDIIMLIRFNEYDNLYNFDRIETSTIRDNDTIIIVDASFFHPDRVRNLNYGYKLHINQTLHSLLKRVYQGMKINVFLIIGDIKYTQNPIANIKLIFQEKYT